MNSYNFIGITLYLALALPLCNFLLVNLLKDKVARNTVVNFAVLIIVAAALCFDAAFWQLYIDREKNFFFLLWNWISIAPSINSNLAINLDMLSGVMGVVVLNVSALVHLYSIWYMAEDKHQEKFISYLSLFTFFMLVLIFSDNFLQLFMGWEGVGLCSYLLIGFWYNKKSASKASIKAFIVNRVADVGLIMAMSLMLMTFKSLEFGTVLHLPNIVQVQQESFYSLTMLDIIALSIFIGCMGKSAQIFFHVWLPDAMEGPTPVSALIHAATMVTAGVFLLVRCSPLFEHSPFVLNLVTIVGAVTAIFAGSVALAQNDIKKVIAYSTCSQLGYMFFACGLSAYQAAIFHLYTHAFFKALLFLAAGNVIHGMQGEQNIEKMGGLKKDMPATYIMMLIGSLALVGIFPFAGFFSKDAIIESAQISDARFAEVAYYSGLVAAFFTASYSWRLIILTFGKKTTEKANAHPHEASVLALIPLIILAIGAVLSGFVGKAIGMLEVDFWRDSIFVLQQKAHKELDAQLLPMMIGICGMLCTYVIYQCSFLQKIRSVFSAKLLQNAYYFDCTYDLVFIKTTRSCSKFFYKILDNKIIDAFPRVLTTIVQSFGYVLRDLHSGNVQTYIKMCFCFISLTFYDIISNLPSYEFWLLALASVFIYSIITSTRRAKQTNLNDYD